MRIQASLCLAVFSLILAGHAAAQVAIDDFTAGAVDLHGASGTDITHDGGILGGERVTQFTLTAGSTWNPYLGQDAGGSYQGNTGWLFYSSSFGNLSSWSVTYGASSDMDANLTRCGADRMILGACCQLDVDADGTTHGPWGVDGTPMSVTVWSDGVPQTVSRVLYGNSVVSQGPAEFEFLFADFPAIDFSNVDRIRFEFYQTAQNPAVDYGIHGIFLNCSRSLDTVDTPVDFSLGNAYPNPFNPATTLSFTLEETGMVNLAVYDVAGRHVSTLVDGLTAAGSHTVTFDAAALPSGVYFYTLQAGASRETRKMVLMK